MKWANEIKAVIDGAIIQRRYSGNGMHGEWQTRDYEDNHANYILIRELLREEQGWEYRVKPPSTERHFLVTDNGLLATRCLNPRMNANLALTFEDGKLIKAEVIG